LTHVVQKFRFALTGRVNVICAKLELQALNVNRFSIAWFASHRCCEISLAAVSETHRFQAGFARFFSNSLTKLVFFLIKVSDIAPNFMSVS